MSRCDELREASRELLVAEEAYRKTRTLQCTGRLARARRRVEELLAGEPAER